MNLGDHLRSLRVPDVEEPVTESGAVVSRTPSALNQVQAEIVTIGSDKRSAKGFIVGGNGRIVTNFHVVELASRIRVTMTSGDVFLGTVTRKDMERDLALLEIPLKTPNYAGLADASSLDVGADVFVPSKTSGELTKGMIIAIRRINGVSMIQLDMEVDPGMAGSPVLTDQGDVVGIITAKEMHQGGNTTFALNVSELKNFLFSE